MSLPAREQWGSSTEALLEVLLAVQTLTRRSGTLTLNVVHVVDVMVVMMMWENVMSVMLQLGKLHSHTRHLDQLQWGLVVFERLHQVQDLFMVAKKICF
jgi:hypothetical protein